jgi:hypothetical protein
MSGFAYARSILTRRAQRERTRNDERVNHLIQYSDRAWGNPCACIASGEECMSRPAAVEIYTRLRVHLQPTPRCATGYHRVFFHDVRFKSRCPTGGSLAWARRRWPAAPLSSPPSWAYAILARALCRPEWRAEWIISRSVSGSESHAMRTSWPGIEGRVRMPCCPSNQRKGARSHRSIMHLDL